MTVVGRASRSGPLDDIIQTIGRWLTRPGEIDLADSTRRPGAIDRPGGHRHRDQRPWPPKLTVAGYAAPRPRRMRRKRPGLAPGEVAALERAARRQEQMLYTFRQAVLRPSSART